MTEQLGNPLLCKYARVSSLHMIFCKVRKDFIAKYADSSSKVGNVFDFIGAPLVFANMNCSIPFCTP